MLEIEARTMPLVEAGEIERLLVRAPSFGGERFNSGVVIIGLKPWAQRRSAWEIMDDIRSRVSDLPGVLPAGPIVWDTDTRTEAKNHKKLARASHAPDENWRDADQSWAERGRCGAGAFS